MNNAFPQDVLTPLYQEDYTAAASLCERWLEMQPEHVIAYGYLGVCLLFQAKELEAQTAWMMPVMNADEATSTAYMQQLVKLLSTIATHQETSNQGLQSLILRRYIQEFNPENLDNGLKMMQLSLQQGQFSWELPEMEQVISLLENNNDGQLDQPLLQDVLERILGDYPLFEASLRLATASLTYSQELPQLLPLLYKTAHSVGWGQHEYYCSTRYAELGFQLCDTDQSILRLLASFYSKIQNHDQAIAMARRLRNLSQNLADRNFANSKLLNNLMSAGGHWQEMNETLDHQFSLLATLLQESPRNLLRHQVGSLFVLGFAPPHLRDSPAQTKPLLNQLGQLCQSNIENYAGDRVQTYRKNQNHRCLDKGTERPLRIGYISHCLRRHAVGWLAWGYFKHCDRQQFEIYTYFIESLSEEADNWRRWYAAQSTQTYSGSLDSMEIAEQINKDEIDILVDLDSITLDLSCHVLTMKPAPVQVSWLGFDAPGIPAVDYFIVDPYVLPANAQSYYSETLWRLPQTYLAVDGFDVSHPTIRRDDLNIPMDAVIYLSNQRASKRNPQMARLQMQIIKAVPNSYFLIKGYSNAQAIQEWFLQLAEEEGVAVERLKFLPIFNRDEEHRANLRIADVILDTYPYNGATTTLEALWMEIPIVTRVGQQFAARNSYTFLVNAGVSEGIAWSEEEYLEWGVRLGKDEVLRQQVVWKLKRAKQTAPLWNARQFVRHMEDAYRQMWQRYQESRA